MIEILRYAESQTQYHIGSMEHGIKSVIPRITIVKIHVFFTAVDKKKAILALEQIHKNVTFPIGLLREVA